uniref:Pre-mRNA cleavage factor Im 25 kDa subunit n=1 Tax=Oryza brachyantha TaxID=4533 RepID=J3MST6_ORYBR
MGLEMTMPAAEEAAPAPARVEVYPLSRYYFGARDVAGGGGARPPTASSASRPSGAVRSSARAAAADVPGLKRKLSSKLSVAGNQDVDHGGDGDCDEWQIGECVGMWWRSEFDAAPFPYLLPNARAPKECIKLFLIKLPVSRQFVVPRNMKLLAVPLSQIHDNAQVYGPIIAGIPNLLSKFSFNIITD